MDDLQHTGILGMKWGHRKLANSSASVQKARQELRSANKETNKSIDRIANLGGLSWLPTKKNKQADKVFIERLGVQEKAHDNLQKAYKKAKKDTINELVKQGHDRKTAEVVSNISTGKAMAQSILLGSYGALKYNEARAHGASKKEAVVKGIASNWKNNLTYGHVGRKEKKTRALGG